MFNQAFVNITARFLKYVWPFYNIMKGLRMRVEKMIVLKKKIMDEVTESRIEVQLHQEKVDFINDAYEKGLLYWK